MNKKYVIIGAFAFNTIMSFLAAMDAYKAEAKKSLK